MNDKPQIKLSETVVLIDAAFLNFVITDMKGYFEDTLQRSLQEIDLSILTTYLTLDAGITEGKNEVQFLFVYDKESGRLVHCRPSDLEKELNGRMYRCRCAARTRRASALRCRACSASFRRRVCKF